LVTCTNLTLTFTKLLTFTQLLKKSIFTATSTSCWKGKCST